MLTRYAPYVRTGMAGAVAGGFAVLLVVANRPELPKPPPASDVSEQSHVGSVAWSVTGDDQAEGDAEPVSTAVAWKSPGTDTIVPVDDSVVLSNSSVSLASHAEAEAIEPAIDSSAGPIDTSYQPAPPSLLPNLGEISQLEQLEQLASPRATRLDRASEFTTQSEARAAPRTLPLPITHAIEHHPGLDELAPSGPTDLASASIPDVADPLDFPDTTSGYQTPRCEPGCGQSDPAKLAELGPSNPSLLERLLPEMVSDVEPAIVTRSSVSNAETEDRSVRSDRSSRAHGDSTGPVTKHRCVIRDPETADALLTVTIPDRVASSPIEPEELAAKRAEFAAKRANMRLKQSNQASAIATDATSTPSMAIDFESSDRPISLHLNNVQLADLLHRLSQQSRVEIISSPTTAGTITANVSGENMLDALSRLLEPFGFVVLTHRGTLVVRRAGEDFFPFAASPKSFIPQDPIVVAAASIDQATVNSYPVTRLPQVPPTEAMQPTENRVGQVAYHADAAMVPGVSPESAALPTAASHRPQPPSPAEVRAARMERATVRIAEVAQDAFAAERCEYAIEVLVEGVIRYPSSPLLLRLLGEGYMLQGDFKLAEEAYRRAISIDKSDRLAYELLADTLDKMGQPQRAEHYRMQSRMSRN